MWSINIDEINRFACFRREISYGNWWSL